MSYHSGRRMKALQRHVQVMDLYVKGLTAAEIAKELGLPDDCGIAQVHSSIAAIRKRWKASSVRDFDLMKERQLAKLELLEKELWKEWERSGEDSVTEKTVSRVGRGGNALEALDDGEPQSGQTRTVTTTQRNRNPSYSGQIIQVIEAQNEVLGITAKTAGESTSPAVVSFNIVALPSREEEMKRLEVLEQPPADTTPPALEFVTEVLPDTA